MTTTIAGKTTDEAIATFKHRLWELWKEQERIEQMIFETMQQTVEPPTLDYSDWTKETAKVYQF